MAASGFAPESAVVACSIAFRMIGRLASNGIASPSRVTPMVP